MFVFRRIGPDLGPGKGGNPMNKKQTTIFSWMGLAILTTLLALLAPAAGGAAAAQAQSEPVRIHFPPGATSATVEGSLARAGVDEYIFAALAGQVLTLKLATSQGQATLSLSGPSNPLLVSDRLANSTVTGTLIYSGDYTISVHASGQEAVQYSLTVSIPPLPPSPEPSGQQRIRFAPGATSATFQGQLKAAESYQYVLRLLAHQLLEADVFEQGVSMVIQGADGTMVAQPGTTGFRGYVPTTQDYLVTVTAGKAPASYTLQLIVPARITFGRGGASGAVQGVLAPQGRGHYVVRASAGQTLSVFTHAGQGEVILVIFGVDGDVLISDHAGAMTFTGKLPTTEDYLIDLVSVGPQPATFTMTVTIPPK
jgi:hypothetical protein